MNLLHFLQIVKTFRTLFRNYTILEAYDRCNLLFSWHSEANKIKRKQICWEN